MAQQLIIQKFFQLFFSNEAIECKKKMYGIIVIALIINILPTKTMSQPNLFERSYQVPGVDISFSVRQLPDSSVYLFGYTELGTIGGYDYQLMKLTANGDVCWTKNFGTANVDFGLFMNRADSTNLILIGTTVNSTPSFGDDVLLIKVDSAGNEIWRKVIGGIGSEVCRYVEQTADGGYIFCGIAPDPFGSNDAFIVKTDSLGNEVWTQLLGGPDNDVASRIVAISDSTWAVSIDTKLGGSGSYDVQVVGLDDVGNVIFDHIHSDSLTNGCQGILYTSNQRLVAFGETETFPLSYFNFLVHVFDNSGGPVRDFNIGGSGAEAMFDMIEMPGGDYLGTGYTNSSSGGLLPINMAVMRMDTLGQLKWFREFGGSGVDIGYQLTPSLYGTYFMTGRVMNSDEDFFLLHFDDNGLTGLGEPFNNLVGGLVLYPNPAADWLYIDGDPAEISIYQGDGRLVSMIRQETVNNRQVVDIKHFEPGVYLVRGKRNGRPVSGKFLKLH